MNEFEHVNMKSIQKVQHEKNKQIKDKTKQKTANKEKTNRKKKEKRWFVCSENRGV